MDARHIALSLLVTATIMTARVVAGSDISLLAFGSVREVQPAAFGDFNSDELTDVFVIRNNRRTVEVFLAADEEPLLRASGLACNFSRPITSVVPGDFDGDAFMDVLVTTEADSSGKYSHVHIAWGGLDHLNCSSSAGRGPLLKLLGQPLAIDYNQDMIVDLFGVDADDGDRYFYLFNSSNRGVPQQYRMEGYPINNEVIFIRRVPSASKLLKKKISIDRSVRLTPTLSSISITITRRIWS